MLAKLTLQFNCQFDSILDFLKVVQKHDIDEHCINTAQNSVFPAIWNPAGAPASGAAL